MNKQELIEEIKNLENHNASKRTWVNRGVVLELVEELDEPKKVTVPQFVTNWIDYCKKHNFTLFGCLDPEGGFESLANETFEGDVRKCIRWCRRESDIFARAWLDGYTVEKEKKYIVKINNVFENASYINHSFMNKRWIFADILETDGCKTKHTRKELEEAGFGEVFNSPLFEVEEVEE